MKAKEIIQENILINEQKGGKLLKARTNWSQNYKTLA